MNKKNCGELITKKGNASEFLGRRKMCFFGRKTDKMCLNENQLERIEREMVGGAKGVGGSFAYAVHPGMQMSGCCVVAAGQVLQEEAPAAEAPAAAVGGAGVGVVTRKVRGVAVAGSTCGRGRRRSGAIPRALSRAKLKWKPKWLPSRKEIEIGSGSSVQVEWRRGGSQGEIKGEIQMEFRGFSKGDWRKARETDETRGPRSRGIPKAIPKGDSQG